MATTDRLPFSSASPSVYTLMSSAMSRMLVSSNEVVAEKPNLSCHWLISRWLSPQWMVVVTLTLSRESTTVLVVLFRSYEQTLGFGEQ
ncbi:hypothetical protein [Primorskyibacter flagellatus]|nr:hypothetical protein [Primorskyibacter flagellatus]